jgi:putative PEP-CTERM system integral membrane protein
MSDLPSELPPVEPVPVQPANHPNGVRRFLGWVFNIKVLGYGLFWSWNVIFLAFMFLGFAPNIWPETWAAIQHDLIPVDYLIMSIVVTLIPLFAVLLGVTLLRRSPGKLLALGYGVQGPLMVLLLARLFIVRQANLAVVMLYAVAVVGVFTLLWQLLDKRINSRSAIADAIRLVGLTLLFLIGIYAAILVTFYAIPILSEMPQFFKDAWRQIWYAFTHLTWQTLAMLPLTVFGLVLMLYTATLFVVAPIATPTLYVIHWWRGIKSVAARRGKLMAGLLAAGVALATMALFVAANQQPQHRAYSLLETPPQTIEQAKKLLAQSQVIRQGLLNAYLAPTRYISAVGEVGHIRSMWAGAFNQREDGPFPVAVERFYELAARPLLYEPMQPTTETTGNWWDQRALRNEPTKAAELYEQFFDESITDGERKVILKAVRDTWSGDQALTAWQAVDDREILLTEQQVNITEHGDWAEVELFEAYENQTSQRQEVVYYFNLPETAVVTGLWLGDSPDRDKRFVYHVAPRGAAQQVYREQLRVNMDPALLEQLGPRQYRLRVFPIESQRWSWDDSTRLATVTAGAQLYLWMTYDVLAEGDSWPLPQLAEKANVYWDKNSERSVNGVNVDGTAEAWLPKSVAATQPVEPVAHQVTFANGETVLIRPVNASSLPKTPGDLRLAVVLDRSYSMAAQEDSVADALSRLQALNPNSDVYLTSSVYRGEQASVAKLADVIPNKIIYYGGQNAAELLGQFFNLSQGRRYDALLILTDGVGFKLGGQSVQLPVPDAPVWMIHLGGELPYGYDDATLQAIQASGGGVAGSLDEALTRLSISLDASALPEGTLRDVVDGYELLTIPAGGQIPATAGVVSHEPGDAFAALAARRLILSEMYCNRGQINQLETLDALHELAVEQHIVTPYSSMIVLVNARQEDRLRGLEGQDNRFEREAEGVGETIPAQFEVTGVPEPHEWLLLGLGAAMLGWLAWRKRVTV